MTDTAGNAGLYKQYRAKRDCAIFAGEFAIGASGAASVTNVDDPVMTLTKSATGQYALVYPKCYKVSITANVKSAVSTVRGVSIAAVSATAGTATLVTWGGTTDIADTEPASGDAVYVWVHCETRSS